MLWFKKKTPVKQRIGERVYKQVAVTPAAHARLRALAEKTNSSIIDTVDVLVGV